MATPRRPRPHARQRRGQAERREHRRAGGGSSHSRRS